VFDALRIALFFIRLLPRTGLGSSISH
jgi:hypothetical protein